MSNSTKIYKSKWIGIFFLLAFIAYGFGRSFFERENTIEQYTGAILILLNTIMVLFIGVWFKKTLRQYNEMVGNIYFLTRLLEAIALGSITLNLITTINVSNDLGYLLAMVILGIGSIPMCILLYKHEIVPKWLALWGVTGYVIFAFGFIMELIGKNWSMYLLGLAALWEITFAIWLIIKGGNEKD
tara:strand:- start:101 stop:658 length:558 start_codon:yes stop_codon:yes gene_type:complete